MLERSYQTRQGTIRYWVSAPGPRGTALVFLPGLTADHRLFQMQFSFFASRRPLLVWDAPGHGASRPFALDFSLMEQAEWLHGILVRERMGGPVLIGQSMGGYLAQCFMERFPGQARGFISIDSAPLQRRYVTAAELWALRRCELLYRCYPWSILRKAGARGCAETAQGQTLMKEMMDCYSKREFSALAGHGFRALAEAMAADLPYKVDCPALLLCGERDRAGLTRRYNRRWSEETGIPPGVAPERGAQLQHGRAGSGQLHHPGLPQGTWTLKRVGGDLARWGGRGRPSTADPSHPQKEKSYPPAFCKFPKFSLRSIFGKRAA